MNSNRHIDPEDLALFALQFLTPEQAEQIQQHVETCDLCREELALIQGDLALYAGTAEMESPPAAARDRLLQQVGREGKPQTSQTPRLAEAPTADGVTGKHSVPFPIRPDTRAEARFDTRPKDREQARPQPDEDDLPQRSGLNLVGRAVPWLGWAVAAGLAFTVQRVNGDRDSLRHEVDTANHQIAQVTADSNDARRLMETITDPTAQRVTLTLSKQAAVPQGKATYVPARGALVFVANNLEPLKPAKVYELWIIPANGQSPVAAGTFHPDAGGNASVLMPKLPLGLTAKAFGITVENEGGSTTPTMPILLAGAAGA